MLARAEHTAQAAGGRWWRDAMVAVAGAGLPGLFGDAAFVLRPGVAFDDVCRRVDAVFGRPVPVAVWSPFDMDVPEGGGFRLEGHPPLLVRPPGSLPLAVPAGLAVREVTDVAGLAAFERTLVDGYPVPDWAALPVGAVLPPGLLDSGLVRWFLGWAGGKPVATAASVHHSGVNLVEWVACRSEVRGRGYGRAVASAAVAAHPTSPSVLLASDAGRPLYERLGFAVIERWTLGMREV